MPFVFLAIGAAVLLTGSGIYAAGEGVDNTGDGALKLALAAGGLYIIYKKVN